MNWLLVHEVSSHEKAREMASRAAYKFWSKVCGYFLSNLYNSWMMYTTKLITGETYEDFLNGLIVSIHSYLYKHEQGILEY